MSISLYTAPDQVRAALGVSDEEISDSTLALEVYETGLLEDLYEVAANLPGTFDQVSAIVEEEQTDVQKRFIKLTRLFATYSVAKQAGAGLALFAPKTVGDGKATMSRHSDAPYKETLSRIDKMFDLNRERLASAYSALVSSTAVRTQRTYITVSTDQVDVVTGDGF